MSVRLHSGIKYMSKMPSTCAITFAHTMLNDTLNHVNYYIPVVILNIISLKCEDRVDLAYDAVDYNMILHMTWHRQMQDTDQIVKSRYTSIPCLHRIASIVYCVYFKGNKIVIRTLNYNISLHTFVIPELMNIVHL